MSKSVPFVFRSFTPDLLAKVRAIIDQCPTDLGEQQRNQLSLQASHFIGALDLATQTYGHARIQTGSTTTVTIEIASLNQVPSTYVQILQLLVDAAQLLQPDDILLWQHRMDPIDVHGVGFVPQRTITHRIRPAHNLPPIPPAPEGISIRTFADADLEAFVEVNNAAFAHHPDQGHWSCAMAQERLAQPWVRYADIFIARTPSDELVGFHWTKRHRDEQGTPMGEVYVLGVHPKAQGSGLGQYLLLYGLHALANGGAQALDLWVDEADLAPKTLYTKLSFEVCARSVCSRFQGLP